MSKNIRTSLGQFIGDFKARGLNALKELSMPTESRQKIGTDPVSIETFIEAIKKLPSDPPRDTPGKWYKTQKEHWLGWLSQYHSPGAYGRQVDLARDAKYAYSHIVEYKMLLWITKAAGVDAELVSAATEASEAPPTLQGKSAAIRRIIPWETLRLALWG